MNEIAKLTEEAIRGINRGALEVGIPDRSQKCMPAIGMFLGSLDNLLSGLRNGRKIDGCGCDFVDIVRHGDLDGSRHVPVCGGRSDV